MKLTLKEIERELRELYSIKDENFIHVNDAADYCEVQIRESNRLENPMPKIESLVIKPMFTNAELNDLESYIENIERDGSYWGNKNHFIKRKESIKAKLNYMRNAL